MLTKRASDYLSSLQRGIPLPVSAIERKLVDQGYPVFPEWLAFHERFAGYCENVGGGDVAVWGLARKDSTWCGSEQISVYVYDSTPIYIACADAHPSHNYELKPDGTFLGGAPKSESFEIKVERTALYWEFGANTKVRTSYSGPNFPADRRDALLAEMQPYAVSEASDKYGNYCMSPTKLVCMGRLKPMARILERDE